MVCLVCRTWVGRLRGALCDDCRDGLTPGPVVTTRAGVTVVAAFAHTGPARMLVHRLKYEGVAGSERPLIKAMSALIPAGAGLVPVPRAPVRSIRYGVDPALILASALADTLGGKVETVLEPKFWAPRRAGSRKRSSLAPPLRLRRPPRSAQLCIVDDVVTTGATIDSAHRALAGATSLAVTATGVPGRASAADHRSTGKRD